MQIDTVCIWCIGFGSLGDMFITCKCIRTCFRCVHVSIVCGGVWCAITMCNRSIASIHWMIWTERFRFTTEFPECCVRGHCVHTEKNSKAFDCCVLNFPFLHSLLACGKRAVVSTTGVQPKHEATAIEKRTDFTDQHRMCAHFIHIKPLNECREKQFDINCRLDWLSKPTLSSGS